MLKTNKQIKKIAFTAIFAVFMIPSIVSAGTTGSSGSGSWGGDSWGDWGGYAPTYQYTYTPNYSYTSPSYNSGSSYSGSSYVPSYGSYSYPSYSYGSSYVPSYGSSYTSSYVPSGSNTSNNVDVRNTNTTTSTASASASSTNINNNINNNNVYVYTNPGGNAVVYNPTHVNLTGYCVITPSNPRTGQTVTATAYASGGVGDYTYTWGGDINYATGAATSFTSYTSGTKYINVTIRSGQEVVTKTCTVTFENSYVNNYYGYSSSVTSGTPVSGIYTQRITSGTPISGVYLNELPATGISLTFTHYMIIVMTLILATVASFIYQARKKLLIENI